MKSDAEKTKGKQLFFVACPFRKIER